MTGATPAGSAPGDIEVRRFQTADLGPVRELHGSATSGARLRQGRWDDDLDSIHDIYLDSGGEFLVGILDGRLVVTGALRRVNASVAEITRLRVHPYFQRRGFALAVLTQLEAFARGSGYSGLRLVSELFQSAAQQLFIREGFRETGRGEITGVGVIYYEKRLA